MTQTMNDRPSREPACQRVLLVTGMSGAGKTTALQVLEDMGWETHDNFPLNLVDDLLAERAEAALPLALGVDSRTRGFSAEAVTAVLEDLARPGQTIATLLFLDCADAELARRYNETRRPHPLARDLPVEHAIRSERELLGPLRDRADIAIDTSAFATNQLQQLVREQFAEDAAREMTVTVSSFGFARGAPPLSDLLFDVRFLDNPHWVPELKPLTGLDEAVAAHIERDPGFAPAFARIEDLLVELVPRYAAQGRSYLNIAFGCTGGRHRSVYCAEAAARLLREAGFSPTVLHRNLG